MMISGETEVNFEDGHCVKSVPIRSFSGQHFPAFGLNSSSVT